MPAKHPVKFSYHASRLQFPLVEDGTNISQCRHKMLPHQHNPVTNLCGKVLWQRVSYETVGVLMELLDGERSSHLAGKTQPLLLRYLYINDVN